MKSGEQVISVSEVTKRRYEPCKLGTMPIYLQDETNVNEKKETVMKLYAFYDEFITQIHTFRII